MSSIVRKRLTLGLLGLTSLFASAADEVPRILRIPVLELRYDTASRPFEPLPADVQALCPTLAPNENMRSVFWIYALVHEGMSNFYVIGGYGIRTRPEPPDFPRYESLDIGAVIRVGPHECTVFGDAREVFQARYFEEISQPVLERLAGNLAQRVTQAFGGPSLLHAELKRQHVDISQISPEVSKAFRQTN